MPKLYARLERELLMILMTWTSKSTSGLSRKLLIIRDFVQFSKPEPLRAGKHPGVSAQKPAQAVQTSEQSGQKPDRGSQDSAPGILAARTSRQRGQNGREARDAWMPEPASCPCGHARELR